MPSFHSSTWWIATTTYYFALELMIKLNIGSLCFVPVENASLLLSLNASMSKLP